MRPVDVVVAGAGPAGCAAAVQCARLGARPLLLDRTGRAGGLVKNAFLVENYPGLEEPLPGPALAARLEAHLARFGLGVERAEVVAIEIGEAGPRAFVAGGEAIPCRAIVVATGTEPATLGIPGEVEASGHRLFYSVRDLLERVPRPDEAIVVGGGEAAFDQALSLAASGARVRVLVRGSAPRARGRLAEAVAANPLVRVETGVALVSFSPTDLGVVARARTAGGEEDIAASAVLVAVGRRSAVPAIEGGGPILTGAFGLLMAGDARRGALGQVGMAVGDGLEAAAEAARIASGQAERSR